MSHHFLLKERRFLPLFLTQFLGAFNDNFFKTSLVVLIAFYNISLWGMGSALLVTAAAGIFILPFFLFSGIAGELADKYPKDKMIRWVKGFEIVIMSIAAVGFVTNSPALLMGVLFAMGMQSAIFGPLKYGILPEHLAEDELMAGNALIESGTFLAILFGQLIGGLILLYEFGLQMVAIGIVVVAILGWVKSLFIPKAIAADPSLNIRYNIFAVTWQGIKFGAENKRVFIAILCISWFWFVGATFLAQFPVFAKEYLYGNEQIVTLLLAAFSIGIALGTWICNKLTKGLPETKYVWWGALGMSVSIVLFYLAVITLPVYSGEPLGMFSFFGVFWNWLILATLILIAISGGIFTVPLYVVLQHDSEASHRSRIIASGNIMNALFMVISAVASLLVLGVLGWSIPVVFVLTAVLSIPFILLAKKYF